MCQPRSFIRFDSGSIIDCRSAHLDQVEADAADAEIVHALELGVGDAGVDDRDATGSRADLRHGVERDAIVGSVGRGGHDDIARCAGALLQQLVIGNQGIWRLERSRRSDRIFGVIDVHVAVTCVSRRLELRSFRPTRIGDLLRTGAPHAEAASSSCHCQHAGSHYEVAPIGPHTFHCNSSLDRMRPGNHSLTRFHRLTKLRSCVVQISE
jgi:hypothetical protein